MRGALRRRKYHVYKGHTAFIVIEMLHAMEKTPSRRQ